MARKNEGAKSAELAQPIPSGEPGMPWNGVKPRLIAKGGFAVLGAVLGLFGVLLTIIFYFVALGAANSAQSAIDTQFTSASRALLDVEGSMGAAQEATAAMGGATGNISIALSTFGEASEGAADSFEAAASAIGSIPLIPANTFSGLSSSAAKLRQASDSFEGAESSLGEMSASISEMEAKFGAVKADIASARASLGKSQADAESAFGSLRLSLLLISLMFLIAFVMLGSYSASILL